MRNDTISLPGQTRPRPRRRVKRAVRRDRRLVLLAVVMAIVAVVMAGSALRRWRAMSGRIYRAVEIIYQNPELPNGCEVTSLAMVLASVGCPADKLELYRDYLPKADFSLAGEQRYGPSPEKWYVGDAADLKGGWYCFENPVVQAANGWLDHCGSSFRARSISGLGRAELDDYVQAGVPLIVWVTLDYATPKYSEFTWFLEDGTTYCPYSNLHCVVLAGAEGGQYLVADPISGFSSVNQDIFWGSFSAMGSRAVIVG